jgi:hypothetical protein
MYNDSRLNRPCDLLCGSLSKSKPPINLKQKGDNNYPMLAIYFPQNSKKPFYEVQDLDLGKGMPEQYNLCHLPWWYLE